MHASAKTLPTNNDSVCLIIDFMCYIHMPLQVLLLHIQAISIIYGQWTHSAASFVFDNFKPEDLPALRILVHEKGLRKIVRENN